MNSIDPMDIGDYREKIRKDFENLVRMFEKNFYRLNTLKLEQFRIKVSDLVDLLKIKKEPEC